MTPSTLEVLRLPETHDRGVDLGFAWRHFKKKRSCACGLPNSGSGTYVEQE
jgi:hypothetical protein